jgi:hypothetical protein
MLRLHRREAPATHLVNGVPISILHSILIQFLKAPVKKLPGLLFQEVTDDKGLKEARSNLCMTKGRTSTKPASEWWRLNIHW